MSTPHSDTITIDRNDLTLILAALEQLGEEWQHAIPLMDEDDRRSYERRALELERLTARVMRRLHESVPNSTPGDALKLAHDLILRIEHLADTNENASEALDDELTDHRGCLAHITERLMTSALDEAHARAEALQAVQTHIRHLGEILRDHET